MRRFLVIILCLCILSFPAHAAQQEQLVALTFDDGPSGRFTRRLLSGLAERGVKATFFLCGYRIEQYPELTQRIANAGHEIGLHGYSHRSMHNMCQEEVKQEIRKVMALLPEDCKVSFLRTPGGKYSKCVQTTAADYGLSILYWSLDPRDWAVRNAKIIQQEVLGHVRDGDVILLHDMSDSSVDAALAIVDALQVRGFRFVTVSELAQARNVILVPGKRYSRFPQTEPQEAK